MIVDKRIFILMLAIIVARSHVHGDSSGTGFFVSSEGHVLTNNHVVEGATRVFVVHGGNKVEAELLASSGKWDVAILKAPFKATPFVHMGDSNEVKLGDEVFTVGFPMIPDQGFSPKYSKGNIASEKGLKDNPDHFQISLPVQPGNSGGGLFNLKGEVVGIVSGSLNKIKSLLEDGYIPENVNYAVKSNRAKPFLSFVDSADTGSEFHHGSPVERASAASVIVVATMSEVISKASISEPISKDKLGDVNTYEVVYRGRDGVSLRVRPDASSPKLGSIYAGAKVFGTGRKSGRWVEVSVNGWMAVHGKITKFLVEESPGNWVVQEIGDGRLSMRVGPGETNFKLGEFFTGVGLSGGEIQKSGGQFWIRASRIAWVADRSEDGAIFMRPR